MSANLSTRKPVNKLTPADLEAFPVWEYAIDEEGVEGQDETWVRPMDTRVVPLDRYSMQVATEFRAPGGQTYPGFSMVTTARGTVDVEPVVLLIDGHYLQADDPVELTTHTGLADTALLPMTYALSVLVEGEHEHRGGTVR